MAEDPYQARRATDTPDTRLSPPAALPDAAVPWGPRDVWFGLALLGLWLVLSLAAALAAGLLHLGWDISLLITFLEALLLLPVWWLTVRKYKVGLGDLGLRRFRPVMLLYAVGLLVVAYTINLIYAVILVLLGVSADQGLVDVVAQLESPWLLALGVCVVAPLAEELFFRGFVFAGLRARFGWVKAALISAAAFCLLHLQPIQALPIFVLGLFFALLYEKSRSLWPAIAMHAAINTIGLAAAYFVTRGGLTP